MVSVEVGHDFEANQRNGFWVIGWKNSDTALIFSVTGHNLRLAKILHRHLARAAHVAGRAERVETGEISVNVLCMITSRLVYHQHVIYVDESKVGVDKTLNGMTCIPLSGGCFQDLE